MGELSCTVWSLLWTNGTPEDKAAEKVSCPRAEKSSYLFFKDVNHLKRKERITKVVFMHV